MFAFIILFVSNSNIVLCLLAELHTPYCVILSKTDRIQTGSTCAGVTI